MDTSDAVVASRIILAPLFFVAFFLPKWFGAAEQISAVLLWVLFIVIEGLDFVPTARARRRGLSVDSGKLLDPFADSLTKLTFFLSFAMTGIMPMWVFLILLYRDLAVGFVRFMVLRRGTILTARISGRFKVWIYRVAGAAGLVEVTRRAFFESWSDSAPLVAAILYTFYAAGLIAVWSLVDYLMVLFSRKARDV